MQAALAAGCNVVEQQHHGMALVGVGAGQSVGRVGDFRTSEPSHRVPALGGHSLGLGCVPSLWFGWRFVRLGRRAQCSLWGRVELRCLAILGLLMHSFHAFIDESGDEGFTFKDPPDRASSEWFVISAVVVSVSREPGAARQLNEILAPLEKRRNKVIHFQTLPHEIRVPVIDRIAKLPLRAVSICFNKKKLGEHTLGGQRRLYFYCTRFLLERISWMVRDRFQKGGVSGDGRCKLTFAHCKNLSYQSMGAYLQLLRWEQETQIKWPYLDHEEISVKQPMESIWLRAADCVASGIYRGLELSEHGFCEERYGTMLKPIIYERDGNYFSYGLKMYPGVPEPEAERANRYGWLSQFK